MGNWINPVTNWALGTTQYAPGCADFNRIEGNIQCLSDQISDIVAGNTVIENATNADHASTADSATNATNATNANYANSAGSCSNVEGFSFSTYQQTAQGHIETMLVIYQNGTQIGTIQIAMT